MKRIICEFKENKMLKLYLMIFTAINIVYLYFEVSKARYIQVNNILDGSVVVDQFQHLAQISTITSFFEWIIILIYLGYLIKVLVRKDRLDTGQFLGMNFVLIIFLGAANYVVALVSLAPVGNLIQQLLIPFEITYKLSIGLIGIKIYKKVRGSFKTVES